MSTPDCPHCTAAAERRHYGGYQRECPGCRVRALASGPLFFESQRAGRVLPRYQHALDALFGDDWRAGHEQVKAEAARMQAVSQRR